MKLSTKGRYGTRLMIDLASHFGQGPILLRDIATRQEVSEKYLWHTIPPLKNAGLIVTTRGAHGGYELAKPPHAITLKDIIVVLEGPINLVECVETIDSCHRINICVTRDVWKEVSEKISETLESMTLADMVERQRGRLDSIVYSI